MPIYTFQCEQCEQVFEIQASFKQKDAGLEPECPICKGTQTRQLISAGYLVGAKKGSNLPISACGPNAGPGCC